MSSSDEGGTGHYVPPGHRWSGWPGAWCLDCGIEDQTEICATSHAHAELDPERGICVVPCQNPPCPEPGSNSHNPYRGQP